MLRFHLWVFFLFDISGDDRGPVLEVIVSRTNFIASHTECPVRVIGLSTALANARDLADWLGIKQVHSQHTHLSYYKMIHYRAIKCYPLAYLLNYYFGVYLLPNTCKLFCIPKSMTNIIVLKQ